MTPKQALKAAINHVGSASELARKLAISPSAVIQWDVAPPGRCRQIERLTEGTVTRHDLRPDVFGRSEAA